MTKKANKTKVATVQVAVSSKPASKKAAPKASPKARSKGGSSEPAWLRAVKHPDMHDPVSVPDTFTAPSVKYTTRYTTSINANDVNVTPSSTHGRLIGISPVIPSNAVTNGSDWITARSYDSVLNAFTGNFATLTKQPPNFAAMFPAVNSIVDYSYRMTAMNAKISYQGAELDRAGRISGGLAEIAPFLGESTVSAAAMNPLNLVYGNSWNSSPDFSGTYIRNRLRRLAITRVPDGSVTFTWIPTGAPTYQALTSASALNNVEDIAAAGPAMIIMIEGDKTGAASATGNAYLLDVTCHWEVQPMSRYALAVSPTPSPCDLTALAYCLNQFQTLCTTVEEDGGAPHFIADGAQSSVGSAWEYVSRAGNGMMNYFSDPVMQQQAGYFAGQVARAYAARQGHRAAIGWR